MRILVSSSYTKQQACTTGVKKRDLYPEASSSKAQGYQPRRAAEPARKA